MVIVTSPGSNLGAEAIAAYEIQLTPQQIVVDGVSHDTRNGVSFETIDGWVRSAKTHPYVVGTTAAEFVPVLRRAARKDGEVVVVMTSRKIIGSHDAAVVAARKVRELPAHANDRIVVGDTGITDVGAGLACILVAEAAAAGVGIDEMAALLEAIRGSVRSAFTVETLDYLVKGGRATAFRAFVANFLGVRPVAAFVDGEVKAVAKVSAKADPAVVIADNLQAPAGRVWAAIFHGGVPDKAAAVAVELCRRFDVSFLYTRPLAPSIYLHSGRGTVGAIVLPLAGLPWSPSKPPRIDKPRKSARNAP